MVAPVVAAGLIGAGSSLLGGVLSNRNNRQAERRQTALQREFAQHGVRWRVEDAKAAGIHPLAALGMQGVPYSPVYSADSMGPAISEAGQSIGRAVAAQSTSYEREAQLLGLQHLRSQIGESDARRELALSEVARNLQEMNSAKSFPVDDWWSQNFGASSGDVERSTEGVVLPESVQRSGYVVSKPPTVFENTRGNESVGAGATPLWRKFIVAPGVTIELPGGMSGDASEALESVSESALLMSVVVAQNKDNPRAAQWLRGLFGLDRSPAWRRPGEWLGGKLADLRDRAGARTLEQRRY